MTDESDGYACSSFFRIDTLCFSTARASALSRHRRTQRLFFPYRTLPHARIKFRLQQRDADTRFTQPGLAKRKLSRSKSSNRSCSLAGRNPFCGSSKVISSPLCACMVSLILCFSHAARISAGALLSSYPSATSCAISSGILISCRSASKYSLCASKQSG